MPFFVYRPHAYAFWTGAGSISCGTCNGHGYVVRTHVAWCIPICWGAPKTRDCPDCAVRHAFTRLDTGGGGGSRGRAHSLY